MKTSVAVILSLISIAFSENLVISEKTISDSLPKNMPIIKKMFWGENGAFRGTFNRDASIWANGHGRYWHEY